MKLYIVVTEQVFVDQPTLAAFADYELAQAYKAKQEEVYVNNNWGTPEVHDTEFVKESHFVVDMGDEA